jgi:hypothetical protein
MLQPLIPVFRARDGGYFRRKFCEEGNPDDGEKVEDRQNEKRRRCALCMYAPVAITQPLRPLSQLLCWKYHHMLPLKRLACIVASRDEAAVVVIYSLVPSLPHTSLCAPIISACLRAPFNLNSNCAAGAFDTFAPSLSAAIPRPPTSRRCGASRASGYFTAPSQTASLSSIYKSISRMATS